MIFFKNFNKKSDKKGESPKIASAEKIWILDIYF